jgi:hypothetical protein
LLFCEFWPFGVRKARIREEFGKRRERSATRSPTRSSACPRGSAFAFASRRPVLATAINASLNGLAFERAADPDAIPDEVFAEFSGVLACAVAAPAADD